MKLLATKESPHRKKRTKTKDKPLTEDFPVRVSGSWKIGAHVSAAGGVENAVRNAAMVGWETRFVLVSLCRSTERWTLNPYSANAFALFVKSQRKWDSAPLSAESVDAFKRRMQEFGYSPKHVLPHGSYLVNLGNPDEWVRARLFYLWVYDDGCLVLGRRGRNRSTVSLMIFSGANSLASSCIISSESIILTLSRQNRAHVTEVQARPLGRPQKKSR